MNAYGVVATVVICVTVVIVTLIVAGLIREGFENRISREQVFADQEVKIAQINATPAAGIRTVLPREQPYPSASDTTEKIPFPEIRR
jgi:hypothetical protein